ncbi:MAG: exodeoxyribonuclease VII small subunit [Desulfobacteraceae bacterium]|nr:MAG: exodeoxyribonuclease VII small subunit [Desulfobacteraceae bacterium]
MMAKKKTFEESMKQLEQIVEDLEDGDLPLEDALKKFEDGVLLSKFCFQKLDETEKKVSLLLKGPGGQIQETPFLSTGENLKEER